MSKILFETIEEIDVYLKESCSEKANYYVLGSESNLEKAVKTGFMEQHKFFLLGLFDKEKSANDFMKKLLIETQAGEEYNTFSMYHLLKQKIDKETEEVKYIGVTDSLTSKGLSIISAIRRMNENDMRDRQGLPRWKLPNEIFGYVYTDTLKSDDTTQRVAYFVE